MDEQQQSSPPDGEKDRPFQFSLRALFVVTFVWSVFFAVVSAYGLRVAIAGSLFSAWFAWAVYASRRGKPESVVWPVLACFVISIPIAMMFPVMHSGENSQSVICKRNMKEIYFALAQYHAVHGSYPPAYIADESGKPMHSWRVLILPYLGHKDIYAKYNFDEQWDGPNNSKLHEIALPLYHCPDDKPAAGEAETSYVVAVGPDTLFPGTETVAISQITAPTTRTFLLVETTNSGIHWMEPRDLNVAQMAPSINPKTGRGISSNHPGGVNAVFVDGHISFIGEMQVTPDEVRGMLSRDGGAPVD